MFANQYRENVYASDWRAGNNSRWYTHWLNMPLINHVTNKLKVMMCYTLCSNGHGGVECHDFEPILPQFFEIAAQAHTAGLYKSTACVAELQSSCGPPFYSAETREAH